MSYSDKKPSNEELAAKAKELAKNGIGSKAAEAEEPQAVPKRKSGGVEAARREIRKESDRKLERDQEAQNPFWAAVNLAEEVTLPKPHLTQSTVASQIETAMAQLDDGGKVNAFRKVQAGVLAGEYSQYAALLFGHFAEVTVTKGKTREPVLNKDGSVKTRNSAPEARRLMHVLDAIIEEMPEDSEHRQLNDKYSEVMDSLRDEKSGKVDQDKLVAAIQAAAKAGEPFWTDSRRFIKDGQVEGSALTLADLVRSGVLSVQETGGGGTKAWVAGDRRDNTYLADAIDKLAEAGFETAAQLLRSRTQKTPRNKGGNKKVGGGLSGLAELSAKTDKKSKAQSKDKSEPKEAPASKEEEVTEAPAESDTQTEEVSQETDKS